MKREIDGWTVERYEDGSALAAMGDGAVWSLGSEGLTAWPAEMEFGSHIPAPRTLPLPVLRAMLEMHESAPATPRPLPCPACGQPSLACSAPECSVLIYDDGHGRPAVSHWTAEEVAEVERRAEELGELFDCDDGNPCTDGEGGAQTEPGSAEMSATAESEGGDHAEPGPEVHRAGARWPNGVRW